MAPDRFIRFMTEDFLGAPVEVDDVALLVDGDDRVGRDAEDA